MENRKSLKIICIILTLAFLPAFVFAYSPETTHKALTDEIVDFYNYSYPSKKLDDAGRVLLKRGSIEEDVPSIRVVNHFYDPIRNVGLKSINNTSKAWAMNAGLQSNNDQFAGTGGLLLDTFISPDDFSWERAIFDYTYKDKDRGLLALGHILHLIEDATVPDHTRDDAHPPAFDFGSPYEAYASKYNENTIETFNQLVRERVRPVELTSIGDYFDTVATFTNTNFFSKDTIFDEKYVRPVVVYESSEVLKDGTEHTFGYSVLVSNAYRLFEHVTKRNNSTGKTEELYFLNDDDNLILSDYWQILSCTAVKNGAGIIKLFFDEVEKEKKTGVLLSKNKSMWGKLIDNANTAIKSVFSTTATSTTQNNLASVASIPSRNSVTPTATQTPLVTIASSQTPTTSTVNSQTKTPSTQTQNQTQIQSSQSQSIPAPTTTIPPLFAISPGFGGGSTVLAVTTDPSTIVTESSPATTFSVSDATSTISYITILSPQSNSQIAGTSTVTFSGTSTPASIIGLDLAMATTTTSVQGEWSLSLTLSQGTTTLIFYSADPTNTRATSTTQISVYLDNTAPTFSFSIPLCEQSLAINGCLVATTTVPISLSTSAGDFSHFILAIDGVYSTTTIATSTTLTNNSLHTIEISATDYLGNQSATSTQTLFTSTFPVIINEVAWAGSEASTTAEWIELYNKTPYTISLTNWTLYAESLHPYIQLTGTIASHDFYLLERRDDTAVNTISADQIYGNGGSTWALSNNGDRLILSYASTTIDETALTFESSDDGFWAGGENQSTKKISMERYDPYVSGDDEFNWDNNLEIVKNGADVAGNTIYGTPKARNSLSYLINKNQDLEEDTTLTLANSPYLVVDTFLDIPEGRTLTVEPGVVVKFREGGFDFGGRLISQGTQSQPVVFTSFSDDVYGGDLNGDATSTVPTYSDWSGIAFSTGATGSIIDGLKLFHLGGLYSDDADISGSYVEISDTEDAVYVSNSTFSLTHSLFENNGNQVLQFYNSTAFLTDFTMVGTTTTSEALDAYGSSHITVDGFSVTGIPDGEGFVVYVDSALALRNGTMGSIYSSSVDVFTRSTVTMDSVVIDGILSNYDVITVYANSHATTTNVAVTGADESAISMYGGTDDYSTLYIASSTLTNNRYGVYAYNTDSTRIESSEIFGGRYGVVSYNSPLTIATSSISGASVKLVENLSTEIIVSALGNWWGHIMGPQHPTLNPVGLGGVVADRVDFDPWLTYDPFHPTPFVPVAEEF